MRHFYFELIRLKFPHKVCVFIVYLVSGILHEYVMFVIVRKVTYVFTIILIL